MDKNQIFITSGTEYKRMTKELLEKADLQSHIGDRKKKIGIKPNLVSPSEASWGATTHPEVVAGIIEYLKEHGFRDMVMLEGSWVGDKTREAFETCGFDRLEEEYQVPVLKGHCQTKITCALKNMKGLIPNKEKRRFHSLGLHKPIAHLNMGIQQDFIVVDNICGDLDFEDGGNPVVMNRVMAACDPVLVDAYVCQMMHYEVAEVPYVKLAGELGVGCSDISKADVRFLEDGADQRMPISRKVVELADAVEEVESCSACYGYLIPALEMLKEEGLFEKLDEKICIGQGYRGKKGVLGVGHCTCKFQNYVEGCPPLEGDIYEFLKEYIGERTPGK